MTQSSGIIHRRWYSLYKTLAWLIITNNCVDGMWFYFYSSTVTFFSGFSQIHFYIRCLFFVIFQKLLLDIWSCRWGNKCILKINWPTIQFKQAIAQRESLKRIHLKGINVQGLCVTSFKTKFTHDTSNSWL